MRNSWNNQSMRRVWVVIPLVLFGIVGMQESFADSYEEDIADYIYKNKDALILLATHSSTEPVNYPYHETAHKYIIDEVLNGKFTNDYANISTEFGGEFGKQYVLVVYPSSYSNNPLELSAWVLDTSHNVTVRDSKMNQIFVDPTQLTKFIVSLPDELTNDDLKNLVQESFAEKSQLYFSPKKQLELGIAPENVVCNDGLELIFKSSDSSPACVKPATAEKLIQRGWKSEIIENTQNIISQNKIIDNNIAGEPIWCANQFDSAVELFKDRSKQCTTMKEGPVLCDLMPLDIMLKHQKYSDFRDKCIDTVDQWKDLTNNLEFLYILNSTRLG